MNEDGQAAATDTSVDNINSEEGGVSADEVADVLHLPKAETQEQESKEETADGTTDTEESESDDTASTKEGDASGQQAQTGESESVSEDSAGAQTTETPTFTVEVEDANGNKFTIGPDDSLDEVLAEFEPKNNGQIFKIIEDHMQARADKKAFDAEQATAQAEAARDEQIATIHAGWDKEIQKLQGDKRLPLDSKIDERKNEVFKFMADENERREQAGEPLISSFKDALNGLELQEREEAAEKAKKEAKEETRKRGGMVGGSSAPATSGGPVYQSGSARNASEAIASMGLLGK